MERGQPRPAAASVLVHDVLAGPVRPAAVVASGSAATYLAVGEDLVAVVAAGAVRLPCAVVLAGDGPLPAGDDLAVGEGSVWDGDHPVATVRRWFDPRVRVRTIAPDAVARLAARIHSLPAPDPAVAVEALAAPPEGAVDALLGRGGGLTPAGDDLLAGCLAALRARDAAEAEALGQAVRQRSPGRTSRLSAALLAAADRGAVVPEAAAVLRSLAAADQVALVPEAAADHRGLAGQGDGADEAAAVTRGRAGQQQERAVERLLGLGHTSGWYLAAGLAAGCAA